MLTASYQISFENVEVVGTISDDHFGSIIVNKFGAYTHLEQSIASGLSFFRFPGGTVAENSNVIDGSLILNGQSVTFDMLEGDRSSIGFDITHPELISPLALFRDGDPGQPNDVISFSTALQFAIDNDTELNLIIPVQRYFVGLDFRDPEVVRAAEEMARRDALIFAERLKSGEFNSGDLPNNLLIDIGNEPYSDPFGYAIIAKVFIDTLHEELSGTGIAYELGFQMGTGSNRHRQLLENGYFDVYFPEGVSSIEALEGFVADDQRLASFDARITFIDEAMLFILGDTAQKIDYVRHHHLTLDIDVLQDEDELFHQREQIVDLWQSSISDPPEYYISAWTTDASNSNNLPYSLAGAVNILALFRNFAETGVDRAALWGLVAAFTYTPDDMLPTVISDNSSEIVSPSLALLTLMSESIGNSDLLTIGNELELVDHTNDDFVVFAYENSESYVLYAAVGELDGQLLSVDLELDGIALNSTQSVQHLEIIGGDESGPALVSDVDYVLQGNTIALEFDQDFEIAQIVLPKTSNWTRDTERALLDELTDQGVDLSGASVLVGTWQDNVVVGGLGRDIIFGRSGDDTLDGGSGRVQHFDTDLGIVSNSASDVIFAGEGNDMLSGNDGVDYLFGQEGDDILTGGGGADTFVFSEGHDTVTDFDFRLDRIVLDFDGSLIDFDESSDIIEVANFEQDRTILTFDDENSLTLLGPVQNPDLELFIGSIELG